MDSNVEKSETMASKTLFIGNLPFAANDAKLESVFSDIGPLKQCFVVKDKDSEKCKGFGYVTFSVRDDAEKALRQILKLNGRKLNVSYARKKDKKPRQKPPTNEDAADEIKLNTDAQEPKKVPANKKFGEKNPGPIVPGNAGKLGLKAEWKSRLIIRNLSFKCSEIDLKDAFKSFGEIKEVKIPTKPDGKMFGFGFVHFNEMKTANIALMKMNRKEIKGRVVAVDWALPKNRYLSKLDEASKNSAVKENDDKSGGSNAGKDEGSDDANDDDDDDDDDDDSDMEIDEDPGKGGRKVSKKYDDGGDDDDSDEDDDDNDDSDDMENGSHDDDDDDDDDNESDDDDEDDDDDDSEDDSESEDDENKAVRKDKAKDKNLKSDVDEGKTLFIRNLSYDTEEEDLEELLSSYGEVEFCRLVIDPNTEHPKGMAFAKFKSKEDADKCLAEAVDDSTKDKFFLDSRQLYINLAVSREKAETMRKEKKEKQSKDNRNLFLAREGMIRPGTQAAEGLPKVDLDKRMKVEEMKRQKLKNPLVFISPTRLCVRNIPATVGDKELKQKFIKAVADKTARVTECRIMRDMDRVNSQGVGKSKGYAFLEFSDHQHALKALRETNNNPAMFGENKRLIVEFSLENKSALQRKAKRQERIQTNQSRFSKNNKNVRKPKDEKPTQSRQVELKEQSSIARSMVDKKVPKGLPSHWGPKVRHKARPNTVKSSGPKPGQKRKEDSKPKEKKKKRKTAEKTDNFDSLVNKHKQRLMGALGKNTAQKSAKSKWFE